MKNLRGQCIKTALLNSIILQARDSLISYQGGSPPICHPELAEESFLIKFIDLREDFMKKQLTIFITIISLLFSMCNISFVGLAANETVLEYTFDNNNENWAIWGYMGEEHTYTVSEAYSSGSKSLFLYDTSKSDSTGLDSTYNNGFTAVPGTTYTLLASGFSVTGKIWMYLRFYDSAKNKLSESTVAFTQKEWVEKGITLTAPENAVRGRVMICTNASDIAGGYIDDVKVLKGEVAAKGEFEGTVPYVLPTVTEIIDVIEKVDDGYTEGQLIYSESFENGINDWRPYGETQNSSLSVVKKNATDGNYSLYIDDNSGAFEIGAKSPTFSAAQGNVYTAYVDGFIEKAEFYVYLRCYDSSGNLVGTNSSMHAAGGNVSGRVTITAPKNTAKIRVMIIGSYSTLGKGYFDNVRVYKGNKILRAEETEYHTPLQKDAQDAWIIEPDGDKLKYNVYNEYGDTLSDFSYAGFYNGKIDLPVTENLPVAMTLSPSGTGDDTAMIQEAIDKVYSESADHKMKVIKLKAGTYYISKSAIKLKSGIVLSGEGQGPMGTILYAKDPEKHTAVIRVIGSAAPEKISDEVKITDNYLESGSKVINVVDSSQFKVGDLICLVHPSNKEWVEAVKMNDIVNTHGDQVGWKDDEVNIRTERTITAISGNEITLDYGVFIPYDKTYTESFIYKIDDSKRIENVGIENLRVQSYYDGDPYDEDHAITAVYCEKAKNIFVRNITAKNMYHGVFGCKNYAKAITVQNCSSLDPVSPISGSYRYPFYADYDTESILFTGCYSYDGRHDYMVVKGASGPVVFSDSISDMSNACSETHAVWATGVLHDNIYQITDGSLGFMGYPNRSIYGTLEVGGYSHGWTAAGSVMWNCLSNAIMVHKPPLTYQNFTVGTWGIYDTLNSETIKNARINDYFNAYNFTGATQADKENAFATKSGTPVIGDAYKEAEFAPVNPRSIFKAQLAERITGSYKNAKPNAPVLVYPRPDKEVKSGETIAISGFYEQGAEKVTIYIDGIKYNAQLDVATNKFTYNKSNLGNGIHKIYATQTIDGVEGNKTADRFIIIETMGSSRPSYHQSVYSSDVMSLLSNDTRRTYDEVLYGAEITSVTLNEETSEWYITVNPSTTEGIGKYVISMENAQDTVITEFNEENIYKLSDVSGKYSNVTLTVFDKNNAIYEMSAPFYADFTYSGGNGTDENPYRITSRNQFVNIFGKDSTADFTKTYLLTGFDETAMELPATYIPSSTAFSGKLIGGNFVNGQIENVIQKINMNIVTASTARVTDSGNKVIGVLFDVLNGAGVKNLSFHGNVTATNATAYFGILAGKVYGTANANNETEKVIENIHNYADITDGQFYATGGLIGYTDNKPVITNCSNYGDITTSLNLRRRWVGGIIGYAKAGNLTNCHNYGNITATDCAGGLVGYESYLQISNCSNYGNISVKGTASEIQYGVAGGIAGTTNAGSINKCFNAGDITSTVKYAGGFIGSGGATATNITNSFNLGKISGKEGSGLVIGSCTANTTVKNFYDLVNPDVMSLKGSGNASFTVTRVYGFSNTPKTQSGDVEKVNIDKIIELTSTTTDFKNANIWKTSGNYIYPNLAGNEYVREGGFAGEGTSSSPYRIYTVTELKKISDYPSKNYIQMSDISGMNIMLCTTDAFSGTYDGKGFSIEVDIDDTKNSVMPKYTGLFSKASGKIENLTVKGSIDAGWLNYQSGAGAFVGNAEEGLEITNCKNYASVTSTGHQTAGIAGRATGLVTISDCHNYGNITAGEKASGIVGLLNQKGTGNNTTYPVISNCGNYGDITGGSVAAGISSWVYSKNAEGLFNVGTVKVSKENGIATGLIGQLENDGTVIRKSYNAGTLIGDTTYGICYMNPSKSTNTYTVWDCYNAVYAKNAITENGVPTVKNCYYLSDSKNGEYGTYRTKAWLKGIFQSISEFAIFGDYEYPQLKNNPLDEDRDNFDFYVLKLTDNTNNITINTYMDFDKKMYVKEGTTLLLPVNSDSEFHSLNVIKNGETVYKDITDLTNIEATIGEDTVITFNEGIITPDIPDKISSLTWLYNSLKENESVEVDDVVYEKCVVIASKATKLPGLKLFEFGAYMGENEENLDYKITADKTRISTDGSFGILIYSKTDDKNGLKDNTTYHIMPYATYIDINGNEYTVTGNKENFIFE